MDQKPITQHIGGLQMQVKVAVRQATPEELVKAGLPVDLFTKTEQSLPKMST